MKTPKETFNDYLLRQVLRWDPVGDLGRDVREDKDWPKRGRTLAHFETYLEKRGACSGAIDALYAAWKDYQDSRPTAGIS